MCTRLGSKLSCTGGDVLSLVYKRGIVIRQRFYPCLACACACKVRTNSQMGTSATSFQFPLGVNLRYFEGHFFITMHRTIQLRAISAQRHEDLDPRCFCHIRTINSATQAPVRTPDSLTNVTKHTRENAVACKLQQWLLLFLGTLAQPYESRRQQRHVPPSQQFPEDTKVSTIKEKLYQLEGAYACNSTSIDTQRSGNRTVSNPAACTREHAPARPGRSSIAKSS
jgi:hypothetical protein